MAKQSEEWCSAKPLEFAQVQCLRWCYVVHTTENVYQVKKMSRLLM